MGTTAKEKYEEQKEDVIRLLDFLQMEVTKERVIDWGQVGNIVNVRMKLIETLSFFSGFSENEIHNTLIECMEDDSQRADYGGLEDMDITNL